MVDNNSVDGSQILIEKNYPQVKYIFNSSNLGFGKANNVGLNNAKGKYVFLLNPDTLIEEDTIQKCLDKMYSDEKIGALGVKLIDGKGEFLAESKRGFPTTWSAFAKLIGLSKIFKSSGFFNAYGKGNISKDDEAEVDVLCGAMMIIRKDVMLELKGFDEDYFMYGEDIDLCYRIKQKGFKILYYPLTSIIHYKGESSRRHNYGYYKMFYEAMMIYVAKHFKVGSSAFIMRSFLKTAIYVRGGIGFLWQGFKSIIHPVVDVILSVGALKLLVDFWARYFYNDSTYYSSADVWFNIILYTSIWIFSLFLLGNYDKKTGLKNLVIGFGIGAILNLVIYALLPLEFRFSRAILVIGGCVAFLLYILSKYCFNYFSTKKISLQKPIKKNILIVGDKGEISEINYVLGNSNIDFDVKGYINPASENKDPFYLNSINKLEEILHLIPVNEIIFSAKSISYKSILSWMSKLDDTISIKIAGRSLYNIIGSDSSNETGELYTVDVHYKIKEVVYKRIKRTLDIILSVIGLGLSPIRFLTTGLKFEVFKHPFEVILNYKTWVSYRQNEKQNADLPKLKNGIFPVGILLGKENVSSSELQNINNFYARNYSVMQDLEVFIRSYFKRTR